MLNFGILLEEEDQEHFILLHKIFAIYYEPIMTFAHTIGTNDYIIISGG